MRPWPTYATGQPRVLSPKRVAHSPYWLSRWEGQRTPAEAPRSAVAQLGIPPSKELAAKVGA